MKFQRGDIITEKHTQREWEVLRAEVGKHYVDDRYILRRTDGKYDGLPGFMGTFGKYRHDVESSFEMSDKHKRDKRLKEILDVI